MEEKETQNSGSQSDWSAWLDALERAIAEEGHFYKLEFEDGFAVKLFRGPQIKGKTMSEVLERLAEHYGI